MSGRRHFINYTQLIGEITHVVTRQIFSQETTGLYRDYVTGIGNSSCAPNNVIDTCVGNLCCHFQL